MLYTIALLAGLALAFGCIAVMMGRSGSGRGTPGPLVTVDDTTHMADPELVAVLHGAQPTPDFGPPPPSVEITDYTDSNHIQLSADDLR